MDATSTLGPTGPAPEVAKAAQEAWRVAGEAAEVVDWTMVADRLGLAHSRTIRTAVMVHRVMEIECVLDPTHSLQGVRGDLSALAAEGWRVSALLPIAELGTAHEALRGLNVYLQGWWTTAERRVCFSSRETP